MPWTVLTTFEHLHTLSLEYLLLSLFPSLIFAHSSFTNSHTLHHTTHPFPLPLPLPLPLGSRRRRPRHLSVARASSASRRSHPRHLSGRLSVAALSCPWFLLLHSSSHPVASSFPLSHTIRPAVGCFPLCRFQLQPQTQSNNQAIAARLISSSLRNWAPTVRRHSKHLVPQLGKPFVFVTKASQSIQPSAGLCACTCSQSINQLMNRRAE